MYNKSLLKITVIPIIIVNLLNKRVETDKMKNKNLINKETLDELFIKLRKSNINESKIIEKKIWDIWSEHPNDIELTTKLQKGIKYLQKKILK